MNHYNQQLQLYNVLRSQNSALAGQNINSSLQSSSEWQVLRIKNLDGICN